MTGKLNMFTIKRTMVHKIVANLGIKGGLLLEFYKLKSVLLELGKEENMRLAGMLLMYFLAMITAVALPAVSAQSCNACNCQFNNVQMLSQIIEAEVNRILADEPCKPQTLVIT